MRTLTILLFVVFASLVFAEKKIVVVLGEQKLYAVEITRTDTDKMIKVIKTFDCSTGKKGCSTPQGLTKVQAKKLVGSALPELGGGKLPYLLKIHMYDSAQKRRRRINIHTYKSVPKYPASHGCIRLKKPNAKELFSWAEVGILVEIVKARPSWLPKT